MHIIIHSSLDLGLSSNVDLWQGCTWQTISLFGFMESFGKEGLKYSMLFMKTSISSKYTLLKFVNFHFENLSFTNMFQILHCA